jgi:threonine dehydrogenase-like Zn-dependent dehydrogenase
MKALTWQGNEHVEVVDVPDPKLQEPTDAIIRVTSTAICGSDLHLYGVLGPYLKPGDVLGHEAMGIVEEIGADVTHLQPGDRVVIPFNLSCGHCWMCERQLYAQCETTQVRDHGKGASLFGYTSLYGSVPGGQAEYLRVLDDTATALIEMVDGRGPDAVIDAVGMEAHGHDQPKFNKIVETAQKLIGKLPDAVAAKITDKAALDRLDALHAAVKGVRRGGTVSISGVYGGDLDPMPMMEIFDRGVQLRMGQAHVKRWIDDLIPIVSDVSDPLGVTDFATHHLPLAQAPYGYAMFRDKADGCIKVVLQP